MLALVAGFIHGPVASKSSIGRATAALFDRLASGTADLNDATSALASAVPMVSSKQQQDAQDFSSLSPAKFFLSALVSGMGVQCMSHTRVRVCSCVRLCGCMRACLEEGRVPRVHACVLIGTRNVRRILQRFFLQT